MGNGELTTPFGAEFTIFGVNGVMAKIPTTAEAAPAKNSLSALLVLTITLLTLCVFVKDSRVLLVAPLLFAVFAAVWADPRMAAATPILIALIAVPLTCAGYGPLAQGTIAQAQRLNAGLGYAGLIAICTWPVVIEQVRRHRQIARLSHSTAHFQAMSQRADHLIDELRRAALTDALTGLPNRRAFFERLTAQTMLAEPACLAMIDIDHFKQVNDRHGHAAGDAVLRRFAEIARSSFRAGDTLARIGGEEFAVILRNVEIEQACSVCQRLVDRLVETEIGTPTGTLRITISTGVARIGNDGETAMAAADCAMYRAKRSGRARLATAA